MFSRKRIVVTVGVALLALLIVLAASAVLRPLFGYTRPVNTVRWWLWSRSYKAQVEAQPNSPNQELKHIEWDGWGWGGEDTVVYLTFDPSDSLSAASSAHRPGKFNGIPCKVPDVERKEKNWYLVQFYTNERWGQINVLNCSGGGG